MRSEVIIDMVLHNMKLKYTQISQTAVGFNFDVTVTRHKTQNKRKKKEITTKKSNKKHNAFVKHNIRR